MTIKEFKDALTPAEKNGGLLVDFYNKYGEFIQCAYFDYPDRFYIPYINADADITITRRNIFNVYIDCRFKEV